METTNQQEQNRNLFEIFEDSHAEFECKFMELINQKDDSGWVFDNCRFVAEGGSCKALCAFER